MLVSINNSGDEKLHVVYIKYMNLNEKDEYNVVLLRSYRFDTFQY